MKESCGKADGIIRGLLTWPAIQSSKEKDEFRSYQVPDELAIGICLQMHIE